MDDWVALKQQVKEASDIVAVVGSYITLRPLGPTFKGLCPFHDDQRPSFDVDPRRQRYRCWACGKFGDVINFVQEFEHVDFRDALELLARRAGISLDSLKKSPQGPSRALMLDVVRWAAEQFQECLLESPLAEAARLYLGERRLKGEIVRRFGLGYAPPANDWLCAKARDRKLPLEVLEQVGLIGKSSYGPGYYDRFRDRVIFPIRDMRGVPVGFGGRVLPSSPTSSAVAKYYNSSETPLFSKSDQLYGIDQARQAAQKEGFLAVVEGYTDVLMAHQVGVLPVVATMGTALNGRHVKKLRGLVSRVVLVFDADAGGEGGVDRAMEVFVSQEVDLRIATLPEGLDPCDLMAEQGAAPFRKALEGATEVFEFKLRRVCEREAANGVEGKRRTVNDMLGILAKCPEERNLKIDLMVNRIAHRLSLKEEKLWQELRALRESKGRGEPAVRPPEKAAEEEPAQKAEKYELELLQIVLAQPDLVGPALAQIPLEEIEHPKLRRLLEGLAQLAREGKPADLDHLGDRLDNERLLAKALELQDIGLSLARRQDILADVVNRFEQKRAQRHAQTIKGQVMATDDHDQAIELLKRLQDKTCRTNAECKSEKAE